MLDPIMLGVPAVLSYYIDRHKNLWMESCLCKQKAKMT